MIVSMERRSGSSPKEELQPKFVVNLFVSPEMTVANFKLTTPCKLLRGMAVSMPSLVPREHTCLTF